MEFQIKRNNKIWETRQCAVKGCLTVFGIGIPMHRFPKEESILLKWIEVTKLNCISLSTIICGLHFKSSDYINLNAKKRMLKKTSIPSLNLFPDQEELIFLENILEEETDNAEDHSCIDSNEQCNSNREHDTACDIEELEKLNEGFLIDSVIEQLKANEVIESTNECLKVNKEIQTETNSMDISRNISLDRSVQTGKFSLLNLLKTDDDLQAFAGISFYTLESLAKAIRLIEKNVNDKHLCSLTERIILTLCKLKLCLSFKCLAILFGISQSTVSNYFVETIQLLASVLEEIIYFPNKEEIKENIPVYFKNFEGTRIVLDCTEIPVDSSKCLQCRLKTYSHYKGRHTFKILIGTSPSGLIIFHSKCYGGRASDKAIFLQSNILEELTPGEDAIMADRGFLIERECQQYNVKLYRPPFTSSQNEQMLKDDSLKTREIASARVHIERIMERLKNFKIMKSTVSWELAKYREVL
ncbi:uncharacterized protein [Prorops nasuta]|uniref:uncharacterized protein n=1 Tax=Prorops nasuta TaxID=863751 RepID=UPI0034CFA386